MPLLLKLAEARYTVIAPYYNMHIFANVGRLSEVTLDLLYELKDSLKLRSGCFMGHSMGGFVALQISDSAHCLILLSPYLPPLSKPKRVKIPVLIFAGAKDFLTPLPLHQRPIFDRATNDRALILMKKGTHNQYLGRNIIWDFLAGWPPINQPRTYDTIAPLILRFMGGELGDPLHP